MLKIYSYDFFVRQCYQRLTSCFKSCNWRKQLKMFNSFAQQSVPSLSHCLCSFIVIETHLVFFKFVMKVKTHSLHPWSCFLKPKGVWTDNRTFFYRQWPSLRIKRRLLHSLLTLRYTFKLYYLMLKLFFNVETPCG